MAMIKKHLNCSDCDRRLMTFNINDTQQLEWKVRVNCPFCGDKSYIEEITGVFTYSGAVNPTDETKLLTRIVDTVENGDVIEFKVEKNE